MGGNVPTEFWGFNGTAPDNKENEPFLKWLMVVAGVRNFNTASQIWFDGQFRPSTGPDGTALFCALQTADADVPQLFSTSYGEDEDSVTPAYAGRIVTEFQKTGARGITLLFASGDSGAARDDGKCHADGEFNSQWPAASPWVTGVGATMPYEPDLADSRTTGSTKES